MILSVTVLVVCVASGVYAGGTNINAMAEQHFKDEIRYRDGLRKMGLHEYADRLRPSGREPSLAFQAYASLKFEEFLIQNWGKKEKIDEYLRVHGNNDTELYWLLRLRLAEHHWMRGEKTQTKSIVDAFAEYLKISAENLGNKHERKPTPDGDRRRVSHKQ
jgi:hypothetical protein